jgi:ribose/xylose/arabinose/galactoside ABC-type transport system permease subunit
MGTSAASAPGTPAAPTARRVTQVIGQFWAWLFLLFLLVFFSITGQIVSPGAFLSLFNLQAIVANAAILLILAIGQTYVIITGGIDLSVGYILGMVSVVSVSIMTSLMGSMPTMPVQLAVLIGVLAGIAIGMLAGLVNGTIIARLGVPAFIVTLGMQGIVRGIGFVMSGGMPLPVFIKDIGILGNGSLLYYFKQSGFNFFGPPPGVTGVQLRQVTAILPHPVTLAILLVIVLELVLTRSRFGLYTYAVGGNQEASRRAGIPVANHLTKIYVLSALMAAIAGVLYVFRFTNGAANAGESLTLDSVAAVVIGGASLFGGEGTVVGTLIGTLIIAVIANGLVILNINGFYQYIATGIVIIVAVLIDQARARLAQ